MVYKWAQLNLKARTLNCRSSARAQATLAALPLYTAHTCHPSRCSAAEIVHVRFRAPELVHERLMERLEPWDHRRDLVLVRQDCAPDMDRPRGLVIASQRRSSDNEIAKEVQNQI